MSWRHENNFGSGLLHELIAALQFDPRWVSDDMQGFTWWPGDFAQRVWCDPGVFQAGSLTFRLHAETNVIRGDGHASRYLTELERDMDHTTLNAIIYDRSNDTFKLHSSVFATEENMAFLKRSAFAAVLLQLVEAEQVAEDLRQKLGAHPAKSAHPTMGLRPTADPALKNVGAYFVPNGRMPSRWINAAEWEQTEFAIEREAESFISDHKTHLIAEFPWTVGTPGRIKLDVDAREPHPLLGNGLHFTLLIPLEMNPEMAGRMALELNQFERDEWRRSHFLGSWSVHGTQLAFRCFLPNTLYRAELLPQITISMSVRAHWANEFFIEKRNQAGR